jgi:hypothetical protein
MDLAVDFDGEPPLQAAEVDREPTDGVLASELEPIQAPLAQRSP